MGTVGALEKLNRMYEIFVDKDNKKLDRGEIDALAGFFKGVAQSNQAKIKNRIIEIYQESKFSGAQRDWFRKELISAGITGEELGDKQLTVGDFLKLAKSEQLERLLDVALQNSSEGGFQYITADDLAKTAKAKVDAKLSSIAKGYEKKNQELSIDGNDAWKALYIDKSETKLAGYSVTASIVEDNDEVHMAYEYFFNLNGEYLGEEYCGE